MPLSDTDRPLVFVSVGTDHHPFDRLLAFMATWQAEHPDVDVFVQRGHTDAVDGLRSIDFMDATALTDAMQRATAIVCHGGPSTIMEARAHGHVPIVMARDPEFGEHVDGHQLRFAAQMGIDHLIRPVQTPASLAARLDAALAAGPPDGPCPDRPEARASIERIGHVLDRLIEVHARRPEKEIA